MSSPRTKMFTGASLGAPCMNSGSVTVALTSGTSARRARASALMASRPRSRSCLDVVFTWRRARSASPLTPTVEKIWRTSGMPRTIDSTLATAASLCSNEVPGGSSTSTSN